MAILSREVRDLWSVKLVSDGWEENSVELAAAQATYLNSLSSSCVSTRLFALPPPPNHGWKGAQQAPHPHDDAHQALRRRRPRRSCLSRSLSWLLSLEFTPLYRSRCISFLTCLRRDTATL
jgi:hypothetical protein